MVNIYNPCYTPEGQTAGPAYCIGTNNVKYTGANLPNTGVDTGDNLTTALQKIDSALDPIELVQTLITVINQNPSLKVMFCTLVNSCAVTPTTTTTTTTVTPTTTTTTSSSSTSTTTTTTTATPTTTTTTTTGDPYTYYLVNRYDCTNCTTPTGVNLIIKTLNPNSVYIGSWLNDTNEPNAQYNVLGVEPPFYMAGIINNNTVNSQCPSCATTTTTTSTSTSTTTTTTTIPPTTTTTTSTSTSTTTTTTTAFVPSGTIDTSFNIGTGFDSGVYATSIDSSGRTVAGGFFTSYDGSAQNRLVRINPNGSRDTSFNIGTGFNNTVYVNTTDSNGKVLVGGEYTTYNGLTQNRLIRLNSDGTKDTSFDVGTGFDSGIWALAVDSNGKVLVGGNFTSYNGSAQNYLIRLNSDGTKDTSFDIGSGFVGFTGAGIGLVNDIVIDSNGKILIGGNFSSYRGVGSPYLIRLNSDGTVDSSFNIGSGFNGWVVSIKIDSSGKIVAGGNFEFFQGSSQNKIIRLNSDGTKDTSFNIGSGFGSGGGIVYSINIDSSGKVLVGNNMPTYQGVFQPNLVRINTDGSRDTTFNTGTGPSSVVFTTNIDSNGRYIIGGFFTSYNGTSQNYIARLI